MFASVVGGAIWLALNYGGLADDEFLSAARGTARLYALEAAVQGGGNSLESRTTFEPGQPFSISLGNTTMPYHSAEITYLASDISDALPATFALLIAPQGQVLASSYPARYPAMLPIAQALPDRSQSIAEVLHGKPAQGAALTTSGRIVWAVEPVVGRSQQIIGAVYLQIPVSYELSSGPFIPSVTRILIVSSIFWLILMLSVGTIFGFIMTRDLLSRLHRLVTATTRFADGDYSQRVQVTRRDEVGQLEAQFNRMAEQLIEGISQQQVLAEDNARLAERNRIARDLHDSIKQHIFAVSMQLETALTQFDTQPDAARQHLQEADSLAYHAQQELSMLIQELRPLALQSKGLEAALEDYVIAWSRQQRIAVELHLTKPCPLSPLIEEALWRVAQETLSNVARHSGATRVQVFLTCEQGKVTLTISDNGRGFDNSRVDKSGIGLYSMKERMEAVGGILRVEGTLGEGTRIYAQYSGCEVGVCPGLAVVPTSKEE